MSRRVGAGWVWTFVFLGVVACGRTEALEGEPGRSAQGSLDAGSPRDAGRGDGGLDAGAPDGGGDDCARCPGLCLDRRCLPGTPLRRTCEVTPARCLRCEDQPGQTCVLMDCRPGICPGLRGIVQVDQGSWPEVGPPLGLYQEVDVGGCLFELRALDGGASLGTAWLLESVEVVARIPTLGGTCLGNVIPTGLLRYNVSCPDGPIALTCL